MDLGPVSVMPHLLNIWPMVSQQLVSTPRTLLLFDYDGTLAPKSRRPDTARLSGKARRCLEGLAEKERFIVGVLSSRELSELEGLVAVPGLVYVGNHGLEIRGLGMDFVHPEASGWVESLTEAVGPLEQELGCIPELLVHNKRLTLSVHLGNAPDSYVNEVVHRVTSVMAHYVSVDEMKITRAKEVVEVRPNIEWGKGEAIKKIYQDCGDNPSLMFVGDDWDDEDGFAVVQNANGIAVCIGQPRQETKALHRLESHAELTEVLELLQDLDS